jgi:hypothetical protein
MTPEELTCRAECQDLAMKLFEAIDTHDKALWDSALAPDAHQIAPGGANSPLGELWKMFPENFEPVHLVTNLVVTPTGPDTAKGILHSTAYHIYKNPGDPETLLMPETPSGIGRMGLSFTRTSNGWRISVLHGMLPIFDDGGRTNIDRPNRPTKRA